jgi:hypothetical protein
MRVILKFGQRTTAALVLAAMAIAVSAMTGSASEIFTVRGVPVDATASEAREARIIAIRQGRQTALRLLLQRLTQQVDWPLLPILETSQVTVMGAGYEVSGEQNSETRYLARITYRFKPDEVRRVLRENNIPFSEAQARPMVVLPVFIRGNEMLVWEEDSPWREAWAGRNYSNELVSIITPLGDLGDVMVTPTDAILSQDYFELAGFAELYKVQDILLAVVSQREETAPLSLEILRLNPTSTESFTLLLPVAEDVRSSFEFAIDHIVERLQEDWKAKTIIRYGQQWPMTVSAEYGSMSEWSIIRKAMKATPNVVSSELVAMSTTGAHMNWSVVGTPQQLALALSQYSVTLTPGDTKDRSDTTADLDLEEVVVPQTRGGELPPTQYGSGSMSPIGGAYDPTVEMRGESGSFFAPTDEGAFSTSTNSQPDYWIVRYKPQLIAVPSKNDEMGLEDLVVDFDTESSITDDD